MPADAIADVIQLAAAGYYAERLAHGEIDLEASRGRMLPTVVAHSPQEYGGVVAGQLTIFHVLFGLLFKILIMPWWMVSWGAVVFLPMSDLARHNAPAAVQFGALFGLMVIWIYVVVWQLTLKPLFRRLPTVAYRPQPQTAPAIQPPLFFMQEPIAPTSPPLLQIPHR